MKLANLHLLTAVLATVFGLAFLLAPQATVSMYGVTTDVAGVFMSRLLGATYLGIGVLTWKAKVAPWDAASRAIVAGLATANVIALPVSLYEQLRGTTNALGWLTVVIFAVLAAGYVYFAFNREAMPGSVPA